MDYYARFIIATLLLWVGAFLVILKSTMPVPFAWIGLVSVVVLLFIGLPAKSNWAKVLLINGTAVTITLVGFEYYLWHAERGSRPEKNIRIEGNQFTRTVPHEHLGYLPAKLATVSYRKYYSNRLVYSITYRHGPNGFRRHYDGDSSRCALFFGGSFTEGLGVPDNETMPYQVGVKQFGKTRVYNFGVWGYGPHQMLAALENNVVETNIDCKQVKWAIYLAIPNHVRRVVGLSFWDPHGPRYLLEQDGLVSRKGNFDDNYLTWKAWSQLNKSYIFRKILGRKRRLNRDDMDLFLGTLETIKAHFQQCCPSVNFHVLLWNFPSQRSPMIEIIKRGIAERGITLHLVDEILPDFSSNRDQYLLPYDTHPNATAYALIADYVSREILGN